MRSAPVLSALVFLGLCPAWGQFGQWQQQTSGTGAQLRGISAVSATVAWASGAQGTVLRTVDGGQTWTRLPVPESEELDFRDIQAFDQNTAFILSIGEGDKSRIYKTSDGGKSWQLQFTNRDPKAFYDCFAFWDSKHGIALSDAVDGTFPLISTSDGATWAAVKTKSMPAALAGEGAFAASGTCIATYGKSDVWFGTGIPAARVFHSHDRGANWTVAETPVLHGTASQGIFSLFFWSEKDGVAVGGDYQNPTDADKNAAVTHDGGKSWSLSASFPRGYRSSVDQGTLSGAMQGRGVLVAVGTGGTDYSLDWGKDWVAEMTNVPGMHADNHAYNAVSCFQDTCWAVGPEGAIAMQRRPPPGVIIN